VRRCYPHNALRLLRCIGRQRRYGAHLSKEQVAELVAAHPDTIELVGAWLEHHGVPTSSASFTHGGGWLTLSRVPVAQADALISASYRLYRHTETNETILRTIGYSLPAALHEHVQTVVPTSHFGSPKPYRRTPRLMRNAPTLPKSGQETQNASTPLLSRGTEPQVPSSCSHTITPTCLRRLYNTEGYTPRAAGKNKIGAVEYFGVSANQSDLAKFMGLFRPDAEAVRSQFSVVLVNGGINNQSNPSTEVRAVLPAWVVVTKTCNPTGCPQYPICRVNDLPDAEHVLRHRRLSALHPR
jgi:tripeptidyl-peptidase I